MGILLFHAFFHSNRTIVPREQLHGKLCSNAHCLGAWLLLSSIRQEECRLRTSHVLPSCADILLLFLELCLRDTLSEPFAVFPSLPFSYSHDCMQPCWNFLFCSCALFCRCGYWLYAFCCMMTGCMDEGCSLPLRLLYNGKTITKVGYPLPQVVRLCPYGLEQTCSVSRPPPS